MSLSHKAAAAALVAVTSLGLMATTASAATAAASAASSSTVTSGPENFRIVFGAGPTGSIHLGGIITAGGRIGGSNFNHVKLPHGTLYLTPKPGHETDVVNPRTCYEVAVVTGTVRFTKGSGRYAHLTGHGTFTDDGVYHDRRRHNGKCDTTTTPITYSEFIVGIGTVNLH